jgi:FdhE protein
MMNQTDNISAVEQLLDEVIEKNPHSREMLNAFRPIMVERIRLVEGLELKAAEPPKIDGRKLKAGVPVIRQAKLFHHDDPWEEIALSMIPAIKRGFPDLQNDLDKLESLIKNGKINLFDSFKSYPDRGETIIDHWATEMKVGLPAIVFLINSAARIILEKRAKHIDWHGIEWEKGYCPICGTFPAIAMIKEKIAWRWLHCSACGHDWKFDRFICPYCEHEGHKEVSYFFIEGKEQESAFVCDTCKRYLVTLNRVSDLHSRDLDISAIGLIHLDMMMQDKGFQPMATCEWNVF